MKNFIKQGKTKIVATLGPATSNYEMIYKLIKAGTSVFRLNTSHGNKDIHTNNIKSIRKASAELGVSIPILVDLQGPKIRVGNIPNEIEIKAGDVIKLKAGEYDEKADYIPVDYQGIANDVNAGDLILLDDGKVGLKVLSVENNVVKAQVEYGQVIKARKGINLPGCTASLDAVTKRDVEYIKFAVDNDIDYIALSFVREASDIDLAKKYINQFGGYIPVIAKVEKPQAIKNIDEIIRVSDGIMVARGDLGIEMSPAEVPVVQKTIIDKTLKQRKVCIVATQMLESMINEPIPTRAEASDVANAIMDGTDAVMLSGETAMGKYPINAVKMMREIANNTETCPLCKSNLNHEINENYELSPQAIANAAVKMAQDLNAKAILAFTHTGYTPKLLAKLRPSVPLAVISDSEVTCRRLNMYWGIVSFCRDWDKVLDENMLHEIDNFILENTTFKKDDRIIIVGSIPKLITGRTNFIRVHRIGA